MSLEHHLMNAEDDWRTNPELWAVYEKIKTL